MGLSIGVVAKANTLIVLPGKLVCSVEKQSAADLQSTGVRRILPPDPAQFVFEIWDRHSTPEIGHRKKCEWYKAMRVDGSDDVEACIREQTKSFEKVCASKRGFTPENMQCAATHEAEAQPWLSVHERWVAFSNTHQWYLTVFAGFLEIALDGGFTSVISTQGADFMAGDFVIRSGKCRQEAAR